MNFKIGDKVVCINPGDYNNLTKGKTYTIIRLQGGCVRVISDDNIEIGTYAIRFRSAEEPNIYDLFDPAALK